MDKVLFIWKPAKLYPDWIEKKIATSGLPLSGFVSNIIYNAYVKCNPRKSEYCLINALNSSICNLDNECLKHLLISADNIDENLLKSFEVVYTVSDSNQFNEILEKVITEMDSVIILYSDAIGQGYKKEESLIRSKKKKIMILNSRKRFFELKTSIWFSLQFRRFLESYYIMESFFSIFFIFLIIPFFIYEKVTRSNSKKFYRREPVKARTGVDVENTQKVINPDVIADYWSSNPQTYGDTDGKAIYTDINGNQTAVKIGSRSFFDKVDETFYSWNKPLHYNEAGQFIPFREIFDYESYMNKPVLEVGCGMGTMAMNWSKHNANLYAVDLNEVAVKQTRGRFKVFNLKGIIKQADVRELPFSDNSFNYVYSWGVLHHSPNIEKSMEEIYRVLSPGGKVGIMLYYRKSFLFRYMVQYTEGFLHYENKFLSLLELASRYGDGYMEEGNPYTYPVIKDEILNIIMPQFKNIKMRLFGTDVPWILSFLCYPYSKRIPTFLIKSLARRFGWSLWIEAEK